MIDYLIIVIIAVIIIVATFYIYRSKKNGKKCIGCPEGCSCSSKEKCASCFCQEQDDTNTK